MIDFDTVKSWSVTVVGGVCAAVVLGGFTGLFIAVGIKVARWVLA